MLYTHCSDASSNWLLLCGWPKLCTVCGQMLLSIQNLQQKITTKIRAVKRLIFFSCSFNPHFVCYIFQFVCVPFSVIVAGRVGGGSTPQLFGRPPQLSHGNQPRGGQCQPPQCTTLLVRQPKQPCIPNNIQAYIVIMTNMWSIKTYETQNWLCLQYHKLNSLTETVYSAY